MNLQMSVKFPITKFYENVNSLQLLTSYLLYIRSGHLGRLGPALVPHGPP
jgi:hypothetical protein